MKVNFILQHIISTLILLFIYNYIIMNYLVTLKPAIAGVAPVERPIVCVRTLDVEFLVEKYCGDYVLLITAADDCETYTDLNLDENHE